MKKSFIVFGLFLLLAFAIQLQAQIPRTLSYQGIMTDAGGTPRPDDDYQFTFCLYDTAIGDKPIWTEQKKLHTKGGLFSTVLGDVKPFGANIKFDKQYWLGIAVGNEPELSPRIPLTSVGYSFNVVGTNTESAAVSSIGDITWRPNRTYIYWLGGNVGIGTCAPLSISGYGISLNIADNEGGTLVLQDPDATTGHRVKWFSTKDGFLHYGRASDNGSSPIEQLVIDQGGNVGVGTTNPISISGYGTTLNIADSAGGTLVLQDPKATTGQRVKWFSTKGGVLHYGRASDDGSSVVEQLVIDQGGNVGVGTIAPISIFGYGTSLSIADSAGGTLVLHDAKTTTGQRVKWFSTKGGVLHYGRASDDGSSVVEQLVIDQDGNVGIGTTSPTTKLDVAGRTKIQVLEITGGSDLAEPFEISHTDSLPVGSLVVIDPEQPGKLKQASEPYDKRVAGVISGAGGINPGLTLTQEGKLTGSQHVALTGKVYALATAANGAIEPGDLLTTSSIPGHAMKATDHERAFGTVIGKSMSLLKNGEGLILVLVNLQ